MLQVVTRLALNPISNAVILLVGRAQTGLKLLQRTHVLIDGGNSLAKYLGKLRFCTQKSFLHASLHTHNR